MGSNHHRCWFTGRACLLVRSVCRNAASLGVQAEACDRMSTPVRRSAAVTIDAGSLIVHACLSAVTAGMQYRSSFKRRHETAHADGALTVAGSGHTALPVSPSTRQGAWSWWLGLGLNPCQSVLWMLIVHGRWLGLGILPCQSVCRVPIRRWLQ